MTLSNRIATFDLNGHPSYIERGSLVRMCSTWEVSMMHLSAVKNNDFSSMIGYLEDGFAGFSHMSDATLSLHWCDIAEGYHTMLENDQLIAEDDFVFEIVEGPVAEGLKVQIEEMHKIVQARTKATAAAKKSKG